MKKRTSVNVLLCSLFLSLQCAPGIAQVTTIKNGVELNAGMLHLKAQFYADGICRITKWTSGGTPDKTSLSVIKNGIPDLGITVNQFDGAVLLKSGRMSVRISKTDGNVEFLAAVNGSILKENGKTSFVPVVYNSDSGFTVQQGFHLDPLEGVYGLGEQVDGYMNFRGKRVVLAQANVGAANSFLVSTKNYGILWDNYSKTVFDDNGDGASFWSDIADNIDYYCVYGKDMDEVISGYRTLTGKAPLYGKWAYGYWQSKEHYRTQDELMSVAKKYRALHMPIDNIIQDWDYWNGAKNWSGMFFDKTLFPRPKEMCDELHRMNFHIIISIWPALGPATPIYADMAKKGFLYEPVGWGGFKYYDAYNPAANRLYWRYLKKGLYSKGLDGWWIDSTEPDVINANTEESSEYELKKMGRNHLGSWARYLNSYSLAMTDALYKDWREESSDRRAYILTRSTFAGQQRNAATTWSGDIGASWDIYRKQIAAGVNHCMSGIPYWTFDIGAFVLGSYGGVFIKGGKDPAYQELYTRMFQFGAFCPIFRSHGAEAPREIWEMGEFSKPILKVDSLRYRLMPYIYSLAWMVTRGDYTIMRGLPMDFAADRRTHSINDQFMFGPAMMVCPVTEYMYHRPPEPTVLIGPEYFKTPDGGPGLLAKYYKDPARTSPAREQIDPDIDFTWYTGRPEYLTDSTYAATWQGKLVPQESGKHQFHLISYDPKRIILNGDTLRMVYTSVEQYAVPVDLEKGKAYDFVLETENTSTGAAKMRLFWKTPAIFAAEELQQNKEKVRKVYLPANTVWHDFWTGKTFDGGTTITTDAPIDKIPLLIKAGSLIPMGPFLQYSTEKPADPIELRVYPGADGQFTLYEDENDNCSYEKGAYATITFVWNDLHKTLTVSDRQGKFPGMLKTRTLNIVLVKDNHGTGIEMCPKPDRTTKYTGTKLEIHL
jgi:alpha-D-xyloside xylohydrolase